MFNPTNSNDIFKALGDMNKANAYDVLVQEFKKLKEEKVRLEHRNEILTKVLEGILKSWDERMMGDREVLKHSTQGDFDYWSPSASLVSSGFIAAARLALNHATEANVPAANPDDLKDLNTFNI